MPLLSPEQLDRFRELCGQIRRPRGDRVRCERLQRAIAAHLEATHPGRTLAEIRRLSPSDYDLYRAAIE